jgi:poly(3-hydroxybutyrate) depolymerase
VRSAHILTGCGLVAGVALATMALLLGPYSFIGIAVPDAATAIKPTPRSPRPAPLLGADGTPQPALPQAVPTDPRARTQVALYATRDQAQALEAELGGAVLWVEAGCCDEPALSLAIEHTEGLRTERHLALDAPVFITGKNLQLAALLVNRLSDEGYEQVFLVTR